VVPDWVAARVTAGEWHELGGGHTRANKWRATLADGTVVFVKAAEDEVALRMARVELSVYRNVTGSFLPRLVDAWEDDGRALLVLEDLAEAHWPPPYPADLRPLFDAIDGIAATPPPRGLRRLAERGKATPWEQIASLGVCSAEWLERAIEPLRAAERSFSASGDQLVHCDIWTDNVCFTENGALLLDWGAAGIGNRWIDVGFTLLSLLVEGAERPSIVIPNEPGLAAYIAGTVARGATAPLPEWARPGSTLREDQRADLVHALRWAAGTLGLEGPR
jgi:Phosphotransferase enzyme family